MLWLIFMVLIIVTIGVILVPFIKGATGEAPARVDFDIVVYRNQLAELDQEIERGLLSAEEGDAARAEIHRRMLAAEDADLSRPTSSAGTGMKMRLAAVIAVAVILPVGATAIYAALGSPTLPGKPYAWRLKHDPDFVAAATAERLAALLQANPTPAGYKRLAGMYFEARDFDHAAEADRRAVELGATDAATWSELGESVTMANGGAVVPEALMAFVNALGTDPGNARSRFYLGLAESQIGNLQQAVAIWKDLEKDADPGATWLPLVREHIAAVAKNGKFDPDTVPPAPPNLKAFNVALTAMTNAMHVQGSTGRPGTPAIAAPPAAPAPTAGSSDKDTMIHAMVDRFAAKMEANPTDVAGWQRLAHAYTVLHESDKALAAANRAMKLKPNDVSVLLTLAEAQKSAAPDDEAPADVIATMHKVLARDPNNADALYAVGLAEAKDGHADKAHALWTRALAHVAPDDPIKADIQAKLGG